MLLQEGWTDGRRGGEEAEAGGRGVSARVELRAHREIFISPCLGCRPSSELGRYRVGCAVGKPES